MDKQIINLGRVAYNPKGTWDETTNYKKLDTVFYRDTTFYAKKDNIGNTPEENSEYWGIMVKGGNVTNAADEEDLHSVEEAGTQVLKLSDRAYSPEKFSGKGYKILRKNIKQFSISVTTISITSVPTTDGDISFTINGVETQVTMEVATDSTTDLVAQKVSSALQQSMVEYHVSVDASLITLTRKSSGSVTPSVFSASTTGVVCTVTDSTKREFRNILTPVMINQPNTIYEIRYDFDLNGETIEIQDNCILKFNGGILKNGTIKFNNTIIQSNEKAFDNCRFEGELCHQKIFLSHFGVVADGNHNDAYVIQDIIDCSYGKSSEVIFDCDGDYGIGTIGNPYDSPKLDLRFKTDTVYTFTGKGFIKLLSHSTTGSVCLCTDTENVIINNIKIDGNFIKSAGLGSGNNGLSICKNKNLRINGGIIKNTARGDFLISNDTIVGTDGGKGIQTESIGNQNCLISGVSFYNCFMAISARTDYNKDAFIPQIIKFTNIYAENCDIFMIAALVNGTDLNAELLNITLDGFTAKNCGFHSYGIKGEHNPEDYTGVDPANNDMYANNSGVFVFSRATNVNIRNGSVIGSKLAYKIFAGSSSNCDIKNVIVKQKCETIISGDATFFGRDYTKSKYNNFSLIVNCEYENFIEGTLHGARFTMNNFDVVLYTLPSVIYNKGNHITSDNTNTFKANIINPKKDFLSYTINCKLMSLALSPIDGDLSKAGIYMSSESYSDRPTYQEVGFPWIWNNNGNPVLCLFKDGVNNYVGYDGENPQIARYGPKSIRDKYVLPKNTGFCYFDTSLQMPLFNAADSNSDAPIWVTADGNLADIHKSGTFEEKPVAAKIDVGFQYFCTNRKMEGSEENGIPIYHKGNNVWVNALGKVVS